MSSSPLARASADAHACAPVAPGAFLDVVPYAPPAWAAGVAHPPASRVVLAHAPTPVHAWRPPGTPAGVTLLLKRDDMTGAELSGASHVLQSVVVLVACRLTHELAAAPLAGNKVRKLEFLLADALAGGCDCVVTAGGIQSNHCRATAVASRMLGLQAHLVLRTRRASLRLDPGGVGNLLPERMAGAAVHLVSREQYGKHGSAALLEVAASRLRAQGRRPYVIPVGGSNGTGTWGYVQLAAELAQQRPAGGIAALALACGSGGTVAGVALGCHLAGLGCQILAFGVCDDPAYFSTHIAGIYAQMGVPEADAAAALATVRFVQSRGAGYAQSTEAELRSIAACARATGVLLDPVYTGKALHGLLAELATGAWEGRTVVFLHTGGLLGCADAAQPLLAAAGATQPLQAAPLLPDEASGSDSDAA